MSFPCRGIHRPTGQTVVIEAYRFDKREYQIRPKRGPLQWVASSLVDVVASHRRGCW